MKHLKYRNDFLQKNSIELHQDLTNSNLVREYLENDTRMGDSYLGRLFSWGWRQIKTTYKSITISNLLNKLEDNLQNLLDRARFEQVVNDYPKLFLKSVFEQVKIVCKNKSLSESDKLKILIGWDGVTQLYDPTDPLKSIPGYWENKLFVKPCLLKEVYDGINSSYMRGKIERALTASVHKAFLDNLSKLMDELRKLSESLRTGSSGSSTSSTTVVKPFNTTLLDLMSKLASLTLDNFNHKFLMYKDFLNENKKDVGNLQDLKVLSQTISEILEDDPDVDIKKTPEFQKFVLIIQNLNDEEREILSDNDLDVEIEKVLSSDDGEIETDDDGSSQQSTETITDSPDSPQTGEMSINKDDSVNSVEPVSGSILTREELPESQTNTRTPVTQQLLDYFAEVVGVPKYTEDLTKGTYISWLQKSNRTIGGLVASKLNAPKQAFDVIEDYKMELSKNKVSGSEEISTLDSAKSDDKNIAPNIVTDEEKPVSKSKDNFYASSSTQVPKFTTPSVSTPKSADKSTEPGFAPKRLCKFA